MRCGTMGKCKKARKRICLSRLGGVMLNQVDASPSIVYIPKAGNEAFKAFPTLIDAQQFLIDTAEKHKGSKAYLFTNPLVFKM